MRIRYPAIDGVTKRGRFPAGPGSLLLPRMGSVEPPPAFGELLLRESPLLSWSRTRPTLLCGFGGVCQSTLLTVSRPSGLVMTVSCELITKIRSGLLDSGRSLEKDVENVAPEGAAAAVAEALKDEDGLSSILVVVVDAEEEPDAVNEVLDVPAAPLAGGL